jgi:hypothetical protein
VYNAAVLKDGEIEASLARRISQGEARRQDVRDSSDADLVALMAEGSRILDQMPKEEGIGLKQPQMGTVMGMGLGGQLDKWIQRVRNAATERGCVGCSITLSVGWPPGIDLSFQWSAKREGEITC